MSLNSLALVLGQPAFKILLHDDDNDFQSINFNGL